MKIFVDGMSILLREKNGFCTYFASLIPMLLAQATDAEFVVCVDERGRDLFREILPEADDRLQIRVTGNVGLWWKAFGCGLAASASGSDVLFIPTTRIPFMGAPKTVTVFHDLGFVVTPEFYRDVDRWGLSRIANRWAIRAADRIITVSNFLRTQIIERYDINPDRVVTAQEACDEFFFQSIDLSEEEKNTELKSLGIHKPFLLFVGVLQPRKNIPRLMKAFMTAVFEDATLDFQLVIAGGGGWQNDDIFQLANEPDYRDRIVITGQVSKDMLRLLYQTSTAFILPAYSEGFGLPVLEAMASRSPVLCSRAGSLPEVGGDAAVFFPPESTEEMAEAIHKVLSDSSLREEMKEKGVLQARRFSWDRCARETLGVLRESTR